MATASSGQSVLLFASPPGGMIDPKGALAPSVPITAGTAGDVLTSTGVTATWTPVSGLSQVETITQTATGGSFASEPSVTISLTKTGKQVTLAFPSIRGAQSGSPGFFELDFTLPAGFFPSAVYNTLGTTVYQNVFYNDNGTLFTGAMSLDNLGGGSFALAWNALTGGAFGNFSGTGFLTFFATSMTYSTDT